MMARAARWIADAWKTTLVRNSVFLLGTSISNSLLGYGYWIMAARIYPAGSMGSAAAAVSMMLLTATIANLGIYTTFVHQLPRSGGAGAWSSTLTAGLLIGTLASVVAGPLGAIVFAVISPHSGIYYANPVYIVAFTAGTVGTVVSMLLDYAWIAERQADKTLIWNTVFSVVKIPLLALPFIVNVGAEGILLTWAGAQVFACVGEFVQLRRRLHYRLVFTGVVSRSRSLLKYFAQHHLNNLGGMVPVLLLPVIVAVRLTPRDAAYFYAAWRVGVFFFTFANSTSGSLFAEGAHDPASMPRKIRSSARLIAAALVPMCIAVVLAGGYVLGAFGAGYRDHARSLLTLLVITAFPEAVVSIYKSVLRVQDRVVAASGLSWLIALLAIIASWILLPPMGITGVGWAWLFAQSTGALVVGADVARRRRVAVRPAT